ncbi:MAG: CopD family protein [Anaerolineae bacterium]|nr:CopD family protein [Anaerolineae bacterium]
MMISHWFTLISLTFLVGAWGLAWQLRQMAQNTPSIVLLAELVLSSRQRLMWGAFGLLALSVWWLPSRLLWGSLDTRWVWLFLLIGLALAMWRRADWGLGVLGLLLFLQSALSRAAFLADWVVPTLTDFFHLLLAAIWLGGVAYLALAIAPIVLRDAAHLPALNAILRRFSPIATFCVLGLGLTGIIHAALFISDFNMLITSAYGQTLLGKLGLFAVLVAFGAWHQQVIMPKLRQKLHKLGNTVQHLRWSLLAESATSVLLLLMVALMKAMSLKL